MKKKFVVFTLIVLIIISMIGCSSSNDTPSETIKYNGGTISAVDISKQEELVYDETTRIVYIRHFTYSSTASFNYVYTLYLSENGLPYRYVNGELVEVTY